MWQLKDVNRNVAAAAAHWNVKLSNLLGKLKFQNIDIMKDPSTFVYESVNVQSICI